MGSRLGLLLSMGRRHAKGIQFFFWKVPVFFTASSGTNAIYPSLATEDEKAQRISPTKGIPIFALDALSSAAYGPRSCFDASYSIWEWLYSVHSANRHQHCPLESRLFAISRPGPVLN